MSFAEAQLIQLLADYLWPMFRIGGLFLAAPILNLRQIPARFRVMLVVTITWLVVPLLPASPTVEPFSATYFYIGFQQLAIGVVMGFVVQMAFAAIVFGGQVMAFSMGLGFANMMDPQNGVQVPVVSQYFLIFGMLAFVISDGHLLLFQMIVQSFQVVPVGLEGVTRAGLWALVVWAANIFSAGVLMALPVVMALLLLNIGMGFVARAAPQLNIFAVGFPISLMGGMLLVWVILPKVLVVFGEFVTQAMEMAATVIALR